MSIFLLIILVALIIFNLVLLDLARIYIAQQQTEAMVKKGLRSTLAHFDLELYEQYGLLGTSEAKALYYLQENILENHRKNGLIGLDVVEISSFSLEDSLADRQVFTRQLMERMKYQGPLQLSFEVLSFMTAFDFQLSESVNQLETVLDAQKWYDDRFEYMQLLHLQLEELEGLAEQGEETVRQLQEQYIQIEQEISHLNAELNVLSGAQDEDGQQRIAQIVSTLEQLENSLQYIEMTVQGLLGDYINRTKGVYQQALVSIDGMAYANEMIKYVLEEHQHKPLEQIEDYLAEEPMNVEVDHHTELNMLEQAEDLVYPEELFEKLRENTEIFNQQLQHLEQDYSLIHGLDWNGLQNGFGQLKEAVTALKQAIAELLQAAVEKEEVLITLRDEYQEQGQGILDQFKLLLGEVIPTASPQDEYLYALFKFYAQEEEPELNMEELSLTSIVPMISNVLHTLTSEFNSQQSAFGEQIFVNQYMFNYFPSAEPQEITKLLNGEESHLGLSQQAIEFILYGHSSPQANLYRGLTDLFLLRALVNAPEVIRMCRGTLHPLLILSCTISRILALSFQDIQILLQGHSVNIYKRRADYRDHLKLINYLHWSERKVSRIQALIHHHLDLPLASLFTKANAELIGSLPLWVLPDTIHLLDSNSPWVEYELGYIVSRRATYAY